MGGALVVAGVLKAANIREFAETLEQFPLARALVRGHLSRAAAHLLISFEVAVGTAFMAGLWPSVTGLLVLLALAGFTLALVVGLLGRESLECSCFGGGSKQEVTWLNVARNTGLLTMTLIGVGASQVSLTTALDGGVSFSEYIPTQIVGAQLAGAALLAVAYADFRRKPGYREGTRGIEFEGGLTGVWEGVRAAAGKRIRGTYE